MRGGILANGCGTGKTIICLGLIEFAARETAKHNHCSPEPRRRFTPTIVLTPTSVLNNWIDDGAKFGSRLRIKQWYGDRQSYSGDPMRQAQVINPDVEAFVQYLEGLPDNEETGRTVIISTYTTFWQRTLLRQKGDVIEADEHSVTGMLKDLNL